MIDYEKEEIERQRLIMVELPNLIHRIIHLSMLPLPINSIMVEKDIEQIKKITNTECESALNYLNNN